LKVMFVNVIEVLQVNLRTGSGLLRTSGTLSITSKMKTPKVLAATIPCMLGSDEMSPTKPVISAINVEITVLPSYVSL
jgi:hypothetical protein